MELTQKQIEWLAHNKLILNITHRGFTVQSEKAYNFGPDYYRIEAEDETFKIQRMYTRNDCAGPYTAAWAVSVHKSLKAALKELLKLVA